MSAGARAGANNTYTAYAVGINGGEPSIGFDPHANAAMYGAGTALKRLTWDDTTSPATQQVADATPPTAITTLDNITVVDQNTHRTFSSELLALCSGMSLSDDAGATWTASQGCGANTMLDHQSIGSGPFHAPLPATVNGNDAAYYCAQNGFNATCALSSDGGLNFGPGVYISNTPANDPSDPNPQFAAEGGACSGLHGHVRVGPDGTAYVPIKGCGGSPTASSPTNYEYFGGRPALSVSADNGTTWTIHMVADGHNPDESDPSVAIGKNNTVYFGWQDGTNPDEFNNGPTTAAKIAVSHDDGKTFDPAVDVTPPGIHNVMFPEVIAGDDDRAALAFLGTAGIGDRQKNSFKGSWDLYIATTYDGGKTWTTVDTTTQKPMQRGCIDMQGFPTPPQRTDVCSQRNLLDFNDITVDKQGRVLVAYADGCIGACATDPTKGSSGAKDMVMRQSTGLGLYAAYDGTLGGPGANVPEAPLVLLTPLAGLVVLGVGWWRRRSRPVRLSGRVT